MAGRFGTTRPGSIPYRRFGQWSGHRRHPGAPCPRRSSASASEEWAARSPTFSSHSSIDPVSCSRPRPASPSRGPVRRRWIPWPLNDRKALSSCGCTSSTIPNTSFPDLPCRRTRWSRASRFRGSHRLPMASSPTAQSLGHNSAQSRCTNDAGPCYYTRSKPRWLLLVRSRLCGH